MVEMYENVIFRYKICFPTILGEEPRDSENFFAAICYLYRRTRHIHQVLPLQGGHVGWACVSAYVSLFVAVGACHDIGSPV